MRIAIALTSTALLLSAVSCSGNGEQATGKSASDLSRLVELNGKDALVEIGVGRLKNVPLGDDPRPTEAVLEQLDAPVGPGSTSGAGQPFGPAGTQPVDRLGARRAAELDAYHRLIAAAEQLKVAENETLGAWLDRCGVASSRRGQLATGAYETGIYYEARGVVWIRMELPISVIATNARPLVCTDSSTNP